MEMDKPSAAAQAAAAQAAGIGAGATQRKEKKVRLQIAHLHTCTLQSTQPNTQSYLVPSGEGRGGDRQWLCHASLWCH